MAETRLEFRSAWFRRRRPFLPSASDFNSDSGGSGGEMGDGLESAGHFAQFNSIECLARDGAQARQALGLRRHVYRIPPRTVSS